MTALACKLRDDFLQSLGTVNFAGDFKHLYWLIDPVLEKSDSRSPLLDRLEVHPIEIKHKGIQKNQRPLLLCEQNDEQIARFASEVLVLAWEEAVKPLPASHPRPRTICALIATDLDAPPLANLLATSAVAIDPTGQSRIIRFWDPRVMQHCSAQVPAQRLVPGALTGQWTFVDSLGHLRQIEFSPNTTTFAASAAQPMTIEKIRWLERISDLNAVFELARHNLAPSSEAPWRKIEAAWSACADQPLRTRDDRLAFAAARVTADQPIERSRTMQQLLASASQVGTSLASLLAELSEEDLELIAREAATASSPTH